MATIPSSAGGQYISFNTGLTDFHLGQVVFAIQHTAPGMTGTLFAMDNINFDQFIPAPEPTSLALWSFVGLISLRQRRKNRSQPWRSAR